jgi:hypothetical protein
MSSSLPNCKFVVEGPEGFLSFTEDGGYSWGPQLNAWRFHTMCRATMVLYELGLANQGPYRVTTLTDQAPAHKARQ